ncbi:MAG: hypothetical protein K2X77_01800 [Candidatus Obscuribacterales bacterium]|nr:hypothetical protein [Candidatus Obscuribacterales bacterium]
MISVDFSPQIKDFIRAHVKSVWQLELLLFVRNLDRPVTAAEAAAALYLSPESINNALATYAKRGILKSDGKTPCSYTYAPLSEIGDQIEQTAKAYAERKFAVINLIFSSPVQSFSDAFKISEESE